MYIYSQKKRRIKRLSIIIAISVIIFLIIFRLYQIYAKIEILDYDQEKEISELTVEEKNKEDYTITKMLETTTETVVGVSKLKDNGKTVFIQDGVSKMGIGSGVIVSEKGYIITNEHVSGPEKSSCYITLSDGKNYKASVEWADSDLDLAIVKVNLKCVNYAKLGDSEELKVGQTVYAIGNPIGFEFQKTVTSGIISALNRTIIFKENEQVLGQSESRESDNTIFMSNLIQTDATINPGNSGGPLINNNGEIIGINSVKITSAEGIGFAIPINVIKPIINKFENDGGFDEPSIGIFAYDKNVIPYLDSRINFETGIYVAQISMDSPAFTSGLQIGDIITKIDDIELKKMSDLRQYIYSKNIGDIVKLTVFRNNKEHIVEIKLSKKR